MATNLAIDDELLEEAKMIGGHKTKQAVVPEALNEYIQICKQREIMNLFGAIGYHSDYDYKARRKVE